MSRPTLPDTASQGDTGHVADHNTIVDALTELYGEHSEGAGTPEGTVTATPGRTYADTTAGDLWVKNTGTGNTGWQSLPRVTAVDATTGRLAIAGVEMGFTGIRDIATLVTGATPGAARLSRQGNLVSIALDITDTAAGAVLVMNVPSGFRPALNVNIARFGTGTAIPRTYLLTNGNLTFVSSNIGSRWFYEQTYVTDDPWPATLPGTPA